MKHPPVKQKQTSIGKDMNKIGDFIFWGTSKKLLLICRVLYETSFNVPSPDKGLPNVNETRNGGIQ